MTPTTVLEIIRAASPGTLTPGQIMGRLPDEGFLVRSQVVETLKQLASTGLVEEVSGVGEGPSEWRAK